jgi:hypothetical protein
MATTRRPTRPPSQKQTPAVNRPINAAPTTLSLDLDAKQLLREMATGGTMGAFVSGLIRAEKARREERDRLRRALEEPSRDTP